MRFIRTRLDAAAVVVTHFPDGAYETDGRVYLGMKRDAQDILPALRRAPPEIDTDRWHKLKNPSQKRSTKRSADRS
jgi:hypothetical protein